MKRLVVVSALDVRGEGVVGLCFLDALLALRGQKTTSLINQDNKLFLTVREVEMLTSH